MFLLSLAEKFQVSNFGNRSIILYHLTLVEQIPYLHLYIINSFMAKLEILHYPDPRLRNKARPVGQVDNKVRKFVDDMLETMYAAPGIGLAATQVNIAKQIVVIDLSENKDQPLCLINPQILQASGEEETEEGCLSVPGVYETVKRADSIEVRALNQQGEPFEMKAEGILAVCIQHELDHLDGKLFVDYLSQLKKQRIRKKLEKNARVTL